MNSSRLLGRHWFSGKRSAGFESSTMLLDYIGGRIDLEALLSGLIALTVAITIHEFAHAKAAELAGDDTPRRNGRVTLNPVAHYDLIGSTLILLWGFGWGKPVPINPFNFKRPRRDELLVSLWGPLSNLIIAALCAVPLRVGWVNLEQPYGRMFLIIILLNLTLCVFNLIPLGPLDGSHILESLLSDRANRKLAEFNARNMRWFMLLFLATWVVPGLGGIIFGPIHVVVNLLARLLLGGG